MLRALTAEAETGRYDLSSLRILGSVGESINPEAHRWYRKHIGGDRTPIVDTWWQTETGMIMITPLPGVVECKPGSATFPFPGVDADIVRKHDPGLYKVEEAAHPVSHVEGFC